MTDARKFLLKIRQTRLVRFLCLIRDWQPLTVRGVLAIALSVFAIRSFGIPEMDLVAAILGGGILALTIGVVLIALIVRFRLGRRLEIEGRFDLADPRSRQRTPAGLVLQNSDIPLYFSLAVRRRFDHDGVLTSTHVATGREGEPGRRHLIDTVEMPHRGLWRLIGIDLSLSDALGFTNLRWFFPLQTGLEVSALTIPIKPLPIVAASSRSGDQLSLTRDRNGDLFDIKQYDPSDGIKRILWKTYAKSGELVVRRPEPAIIPEGEVVLYLVAQPEDDHVAGALQDYVRQLDLQQITTLFGTDGMFYKPEAELTSPGVDTPGDVVDRVSGGADRRGAHFCVSTEEIQRAINRSVWSPRAGTAEDFESFLQSLQAANHIVHHVIAFGPAGDGPTGAFSARTGSNENAWANKLSDACRRNSIKLTVALVSHELDLNARIEKVRRQALEASLEHKVLGMVRGLVTSNKQSGSAQKLRDLGSRIVQSGADLYIIEGYE